ncbi:MULTISPECIES: ANTAR domain-containing response regulator [Rhizobium/Agrobacterium group]|jgi:AmiR/NasT family two-component response regulator|uniref:ANTAR domain-containing response regulator n=2 Tax=Rhizobium/Agrobacterium group TaxID=227290 RepID=A0A1V2AN28_AGRTU|nr:MULTISPECIES: ANTAR domain-containing response regulator [Rhizobium/Agrobacterium group]AHK05097.1 two component response regulator [Agrobacterium tumefaciens LBA4213 (Ach5)]AKC10824.1 two component response regulator [Agrobacterium tumefaciens]EHJ96408.1 two component response regulator [Agrobacterium tumefaciens 5A]MDP9563596.1 AmiR/NasT family two-component response regulator [Rhizobium nepotum]QDG94196.1 ANTAR domain-containing response regulator [Rhizobium sp. NIBRBAC000502774]HCV7275
MSFALLRDLRDLKVLVIHPRTSEGEFLVDHLRRIGCTVSCLWPVPAELPHGTDVVFLAMEDEARPEIERLLKCLPNPAPTMLAIVGYENPSTLQIVLESGALAIVERPIKPFGLLTNLAIARSLWLERQRLVKEARKYKRKVLGDQKLARAKAILMANRGTSENEAYREMREQAMARRVPIDEIANSIINAEQLLRPSQKHD